MAHSSRVWAVALLLCGAGAAHAATSAAQAHAARTTRAVGGADAGDTWRNLIAEYSRGAGVAGGAWPGAGGGWFPPAIPIQVPLKYSRGAGVAGGAWPGAGGGWFPPAIPIQVPLKGENSGRASLSVLVVPVPVPVPAPAPRAGPAQCTQLDDVAPPRNPVPAYNEPSGPEYDPGYNTPPYNQVPVFNQRPTSNAVPSYNPLPSGAPPAPPNVQHSRRPAADARRARSAPYFPPVEDSRLLVEQFRAQVPDDPTLPPIVFDPVGVVSTDDYTIDELREAGEAPREPQAESAAGEAPGAARRRLKCMQRRSAAGGGGDALEPEGQLRASPPPPPRFERSLFVRARLTVPRADYTETYSVWWDAASGAARVDFHGGATSSYRMLKSDGRMQSVQIRVDRTAEADVRRCVVSAPRRVSLAERALPALPDLQAFSFAGYVVRGTERAERWRHTLSGHNGELGGARGEALTFRHELLVTRSADNYTTTPHWYTVRVDSSVLGPDCDGYVHQFDEVQARNHDPSMFRLDIADACEQVETTTQVESVEPLREFTLLRRDPRHDTEIEQYKERFGRTYADNVEEAVRKNVLIQSSRHTASGNRQGASFELANNFLADRLVVERRVLLGVAPALSADLGEPFPHSRAELEALRGRLPRKFDWRERGAVTPVRSQVPCSTCWAFATVGAVEGALFVQTGRLVPLSEQALVDCAHPYGGHGCKGTWPSSAYNYIKDQGLPALDEYTPYKGKKLQCRADSVPAVTRISGFLNVTKNNILALKVAIKKYGPTVVIIDGEAKTFSSHNNSYYDDNRCRRNSPNHAVLAVGWTVHRGETYFILKNSWSTAWGEQGYVRMRAANNTCGVLRRGSVPRLRAADVLRVPGAARAAAPGNT